MKKNVVILCLMMIHLAAGAQFIKASLQATGLTCALCSNAINKALGKVSFVESVQADIKNSTFDIRFRPGSEVNIDALKNAVEGAGFSVGGLQVTGNFSQMAVAPDQHVNIGSAHFHFLHVSSQVLNGEKTLKVVDKDFVTSKEFKKLSSTVKMGCLETGKAGSCCIKDGLAAGDRIYHVTL